MRDPHSSTYLNTVIAGLRTEYERVCNMLAERNREIREVREELSNTVIQESLAGSARQEELEYWKTLYDRESQNHQESRKLLDTEKRMNNRLTREILEVLKHTGNIEL